MPRDTQDLLEAPPNLTTPSLPALAWLLRHREAWPEGFVWDYSNCLTCAAGLSAQLWDAISAPLEAASLPTWGMRNFLMPKDAAWDIFVLAADKTDVSIMDVTPEHVADAIDLHLARTK